MLKLIIIYSLNQINDYANQPNITLVLVASTGIKTRIKPIKLFDLVRFIPIELTDQQQQILDAAGDRPLTFIDPPNEPGLCSRLDGKVTENPGNSVG
jgi:hypothetical protein